MKKILYIVIFFALVGMIDSIYLTMEHYSNEIPPCSTSIWVDCGKVLRSEYATIGAIPISLFGLVFYSTIFGLAAVRLALGSIPQTQQDKMWEILQKIVYPKNLSFRQWLLLVQLILTAAGLLSSAYLVYIQLGIIQSICLYCMISAVNTVILFGASVYEWRKDQRESTLGNKVIGLIKK